MLFWSVVERIMRNIHYATIQSGQMSTMHRTTDLDAYALRCQGQIGSIYGTNVLDATHPSPSVVVRATSHSLSRTFPHSHSSPISETLIHSTFHNHQHPKGAYSRLRRFYTSTQKIYGYCTYQNLHPFLNYAWGLPKVLICPLLSTRP